MKITRAHLVYCIGEHLLLGDFSQVFVSVLSKLTAKHVLILFR